ncbi:hypothetical protein BEWA_040200 [Theileria equi strain WA]|uniref:Uncharacterized protein n=1 Tax=Theileria equi strain WA TaxID=1537102 RepID=L1LEW0_THEEQ|nr:hypothetical protein BEWA_040200 [Theileria equi strain WA]EKX73982.1 hypothetical protein BEWA_040200 [Theileria equi strain WA]|eukprot:XP_004833434.1 hypothetical protein BEWA_040200 [Theileria equi strain WA]
MEGLGAILRASQLLRKAPIYGPKMSLLCNEMSFNPLKYSMQGVYRKWECSVALEQTFRCVEGTLDRRPNLAFEIPCYEKYGLDKDIRMSKSFWPEHGAGIGLHRLELMDRFGQKEYLLRRHRGGKVKNKLRNLEKKKKREQQALANKFTRDIFTKKTE